MVNVFWGQDKYWSNSIATPHWTSHHLQSYEIEANFPVTIIILDQS
jgi:hypothetical protein